MFFDLHNLVRRPVDPKGSPSSVYSLKKPIPRSETKLNLALSFHLAFLPSGVLPCCLAAQQLAAGPVAKTHRALLECTSPAYFPEGSFIQRTARRGAAHECVLARTSLPSREFQWARERTCGILIFSARESPVLSWGGSSGRLHPRALGFFQRAPEEGFDLLGRAKAVSFDPPRYPLVIAD